MNNTKPINIVIADDNRFFCDALKDSLQQHQEINVINTFTTIEELCEYTKHHNFDLLILDVNFYGKSALDNIEIIRSKNANFKIIALTTLTNNYIKNIALSKGIDCFVGKDSDLSNFKNTIIECYSQDKKIAVNQAKKVTVNKIQFTHRKLEILQAIYQFSEKTEEEIAIDLFISKATFKNHKSELFTLTNTKNTPDLIRFGIQNGLILV